MAVESLPAAAKKGAISSPTPKSKTAVLTHWLTLYRNPRNGSKYSWVIGVPKKAVPKSVRRSRLKRLVREALRVLKAQPEDGICWKFSVKRNPAENIQMSDVAAVVKTLIDQK